MKKILFFFILLISLTGFGQYPVKQTMGSDSTIVRPKGALQSRLINIVFTDTAQANTQRIKFYDGSQIITITGGNKFWIRDSTLNKWIQVGEGSTNTSIGGGLPVAITGTNNVNSLAAGYNVGITTSSNLITIENRDTLYVLVSGQSNSNGFNDGLYDTARNEKVFGWNGSAWVILQRGVAPMGWCFPENSVGTCGGTIVEDSSTSAGFYFAKRLQERTGKIVRVFFTGYGGEVISNWIPAASTNFAKIVSFLTAAGNPHIDYFLWQHGEANGFDADTTYKRKFDTLVQQLDAQPWFGKDVPIFIGTVRDTATHQTMYYTQIAMGSGLFDKRYTTIDAGKEPYYNPAPYHFSAEGEYNIANKIISTLYNKLSAPNALRGVTAAQLTTMETFVANLGKPIITWDSTTKAINIQEINTLKTKITGGYFSIKEFFDSYGASELRVKNSANVTGVEIVNSGLETSGVTFTTMSGAQHRIVYQNIGGSVLTGNTSGEMQFFKPAVGNIFRVGEVNAALQPNLYIGDATTVPSHKLTVGGQIRVTNMNTASVFDSMLVRNAGVIEAIDTNTLFSAIRATIPASGGSQGLQDVITADPVLTAVNTIDAGGNSFTIQNIDQGTFSGDQIFITGITRSTLHSDWTTTSGTDSVIFTQTSGRFRFHGIAKGSIDTTTYKPGAFDINGRLMRMNSWAQVSGGSGSGVTTMAAIGASPNANGATISGSNLNLEPASASFGGVVTTGVQTFAGAKTFSAQDKHSAGLSITGPYATNEGMMLSYDGGSNLGGITVYNGSYKDFRVAANTVSLFGNGSNLGVAVNTSGFVGIGGITTSGANSSLHVGGSVATAYRAITALRTLDATDQVIEVTANTFTVTLPTAVGITGRQYVITNSGAGTTTIATTSSQTFINVTATPTTLTVNQFGTVTVVSNGANWLRTSSL